MLMDLLECTHSTAEKKAGLSASLFPECDFFRTDCLEGASIYCREKRECKAYGAQKPERMCGT